MCSNRFWLSGSTQVLDDKIFFSGVPSRLVDIAALTQAQISVRSRTAHPAHPLFRCLPSFLLIIQSYTFPTGFFVLASFVDEKHPATTMTYQYRPLERDQDEIRLVSLLPGDFDDPVRISIHHTLLTPSAGTQGKKRATGTDGGNIVPYPGVLRKHPMAIFCI